jgi:hypothetical protein
MRCSSCGVQSGKQEGMSPGHLFVGESGSVGTGQHPKTNLQWNLRSIHSFLWIHNKFVSRFFVAWV